MSYADDVAVAQSARQVAKTANNTTAGHHAADLTFYTTLATLEQKWDVQNGALQALASLGANPPSINHNGLKGHPN